MGVAAVIGAAIQIGGIAVPGTLGSIMIVAGGLIATAANSQNNLSDEAKGIKETVSDTQAALPVIYGGPVRVGGKIVDIRVDGGSTDRKDLAVVAAFCIGSEDGSGIEGIGDIYFDDKLAIQRSDTQKDSQTGGALQDDFIGETDTPIDPQPVDLVDWKVYFGTDAQSVDSELDTRFSEWTASDDLTGVAYIRFILTFDKEIWRTGVPSIQAEVWGNKVYDPRSDTTTHSSNPALCVNDYLTSDKYGAGLDSSRVLEQSVIDEANYADENTGFGAPRFECHGVVDTSRRLTQNLQKLLGSMRGNLIYQNGKFRMHVSKVQTAVDFDLNEDNVVGNWTLRRQGLKNTANKIIATFIDPDNNFEAVDLIWPLPSNTNNLLNADNDFENTRHIDLPYTQDDRIAQDIAQVLLQESRNDYRVSVTATEDAMQLEVGDVITITHDTPGFSGKKFWVDGVTISPNRDVGLALREYDENAYDLEDKNPLPQTPVDGGPDPFSVANPENVTANSSSTTALGNFMGIFIPRVLLTWTSPDDAFIDSYQIKHKKQSSSVWSEGVTQDADQTQHYIMGYLDNDQIDIAMRARNTLGRYSGWVHIQHTVSNAAGNHYPIIDIDTNETQTQGTVEATVHDPAGGDLKVEFFERTGQNDFPATPDAVYDPVTTGDTVTHTIDLVEGNLAYVKVAVYIKSNNNNLSEVVTFDSDSTPNVLYGGLDITVDEVFLDYMLDSDGQSVRVATSTSGTPSGNDVDGDAGTGSGAGTVVAGRAVSNYSLHSDLLRSETLYARMRAYTAADGTGESSNQDWTGRISRSQDGKKVVLEDTDETGSQGTLTLTVGADWGEFDIQFETRQGRGSSWSTGVFAQNMIQGETTSESVDLIEGKLSFIRYKVYPTGQSNDDDIVDSSIVVFDPNDKPDGNINVDTNINDGTVTVFMHGDSDTDYWELETSGAFTETYTVAGGNSINGRSPQQELSNKLDFGEILTINATPFSINNTAGETITVKANRIGSGGGGQDGAPELDLSLGSQNDQNQQEVNVTVTVNPDLGEGPLSWRWRVPNSPESTEQDWSTWNTITSGTTESFIATRHDSMPRQAEVQARDEGIGDPDFHPKEKATYPIDSTADFENRTGGSFIIQSNDPGEATGVSEPDGTQWLVTG